MFVINRNPLTPHLVLQEADPTRSLLTVFDYIQINYRWTCWFVIDRKLVPRVTIFD